jgi:hypothetical protein
VIHRHVDGAAARRHGPSASPTHPFGLAIDEHAKKSSRIVRLSLGPLTPSDTARLLADALHRGVGSLGRLGAAI